MYELKMIRVPSKWLRMQNVHGTRFQYRGSKWCDLRFHLTLMQLEARIIQKVFSQMTRFFYNLLSET